MASKFDLRDKIILAPMVRISTHPMRLLALRYGADYVFSEELIDQRVIRSKRLVNDELNTVDFVLPDGTITFRTSAEEQGRVVAQLGTADADRALEAARILEHDVAAIDINMGCPKDFSIKGGMGAALLKKPDQVKEILTRLTTSLRVPVTCKIRILPNLQDTLHLVKLIESTGVAAISVHGRTPSERPRHRNHDEVIREIANTLSIPVIANGGSRDTICKYEDIEFFRQETSASGVMIARAAMWNPSIFQKPSDRSPPMALHDVVREYLAIATRYGHHITGTKYCILQMLHMEGETPLFQDTMSALDMDQLCSVWGVSERCPDRIHLREDRSFMINGLQERKQPQQQDDVSEANPTECKRARMDNDSNRPLSPDSTLSAETAALIERHIPFERRYWPVHGITPKQILIAHCQKQKLELPQFHTVEHRNARLFFSTVILGNTRYHNTFGCKSKKFSEQAASLVCLEALQIPDGRSENNS